jgi:TRAP-type mannitol/chloroaromatic compound transport system permease small subunit
MWICCLSAHFRPGRSTIANGFREDPVEKALKLIDRISEWTGRIFSWIIIILMLLVVYEVVMRRFFNRPTIWNFDVTKQLYALYFMIVAGYTLLHNAHVAVDIMVTRLGRRKKALMDIITYIVFFFPFILVFLIEGIKFARNSWAMRETMWGMFQIPVYPIKTIIPITAFLLLIQGLAIFIRQLYFLVKGEDLC